MNCKLTTVFKPGRGGDGVYEHTCSECGKIWISAEPNIIATCKLSNSEESKADTEVKVITSCGGCEDT
jgi:hypothetical protein